MFSNQFAVASKKVMITIKCHRSCFAELFALFLLNNRHSDMLIAETSLNNIKKFVKLKHLNCQFNEAYQVSYRLVLSNDYGKFQILSC